jgi:hypothetical protein
LPNFFLINSTKEDPFGNSLLIFFPKYIKKIIGKAVPNAYPMTAPRPPHVAAATGPNKIQAPKADATRLVVSENKPMFLFAVK